MAKNENVFYKIAEALLMEYSTIYYIDAYTNEYYWYSTNPEFQSLSLEQYGDDFFENIIRDCKKVVYEEDQHIFIEDIQKEHLISDMKNGSMLNIEYRLMINDVPVWHALHMIRGLDEDLDYFVLGVKNIDEEHKHRELEKRIASEKELYDQITSSLASRYDTIYYVDIATSTYIEISSTDEFKKLNVPSTGGDFFSESRRSISKYVHPEDQEKIIKLHYLDTMLNNIKDGKTYRVEYRLVINGEVKHIRHSEIMSKDRKHIIVCIENIDEEIKAKKELLVNNKNRVTYMQIAESLASHYDLIYYIDAETSRYAEFSTRRIYGELEISEEGDDFFGTAQKNADIIIYSEDRERLKRFMDRDNFISLLEERRKLRVDYRMVIDGGKPQYTRMTVMWSSDKSHFIMCIENRDEDVKKEREHIKALSMANELARRDELTGTRNKTAYHEMETELQKAVEEETTEPFGMVICDINDLKLINDTEGHKAGDEYIRSSCSMICKVFSHSPVFRIGGDEFAVILKGQDYQDRDNLLGALKGQIEEHVDINEGPVVAVGLALYQEGKDTSVEDVFNRADEKMYDDKARLKERKLLQESRFTAEKNGFKSISDDRRKKLDVLYKSFEIVSEGSYVYLCDMKYDFSKWSKSAVDRYGLPSEYMYGAGDIWENRIHPDDRDAYHKGIEEIFTGNALGHDMQYRAKRTDGEYDVCTCRGTVIRDLTGTPDYFAGTIRNHSEQGHMDTLTGLRNQYGFFIDLNSHIKRNASVNIVLLGISKFSDVNEMYGYSFGNLVLQKFARKIYERAGNTGHTYRIDGTKFAVISNTLSLSEMSEYYKSFVKYCRREFNVDERNILLEINAGGICVDRFDVDAQTIYGGLYSAYVESKTKKHGELVEFKNDYNESVRFKLKMIYDIRNSIMRGYHGFFLMYQPVVDASTEKLIGSEALLRWKGKDYGVVPPDDFIPLLEMDPIFPQLGEWILRSALISARKMLKIVPDFVMNVNLSYTQLEKPDFVDMVNGILDELDFPPEHLCLEVTERCRLLDIKSLRNIIVRLKSRGIFIALDDFGTGFSSVDIVKELPFDIIKIDRGFVKKIEEDDSERELIRHFASIASVFGAKVCVEGIETEGMKNILKEFHVKSFQGYYYAKPLELEDLLKWKDKN